MILLKHAIGHIKPTAKNKKHFTTNVDLIFCKDTKKFQISTKSVKRHRQAVNRFVTSGNLFCNYSVIDFNNSIRNFG